MTVSGSRRSTRVEGTERRSCKMLDDPPKGLCVNVTDTGRVQKFTYRIWRVDLSGHSSRGKSSNYTYIHI